MAKCHCHLFTIKPVFSLHIKARGGDSLCFCLPPSRPSSSWFFLQRCKSRGCLRGWKWWISNKTKRDYISLCLLVFFLGLFFTGMFPAAMSNSTSLSEEASVSSGTRVQDFSSLNPVVSGISSQQQNQQKIKKKRNLPGNPGRIYPCSIISSILYTLYV